ncbi:MAG: sugar transferase [Bacilli bacterium]|nr:sugar transferase [Bacilli bacterium]
MDTPNNFKRKLIYQLIKRLFDLFVALISLLILSPLLIIISLVIVLTSPGGPFYLDTRLGKNHKPFKVIKFRSMKKDDRPIEEILSPEDYKEYLKEYKLDNDPRITKVGKVLRKTSLDELPQLFNILFGQMSLIGPRPIKEKEYQLLWQGHEDLFYVKPGLTGYWGAHGRSNVRYEERVKMEIYYVYHRSLALDIKIFFKTIVVVLSGKDAK